MAEKWPVSAEILKVCFSLAYVPSVLLPCALVICRVRELGSVATLLS
jgi:hypothetical protein